MKLVLSDCLSLMLGIAISLYTAFSSIVGAWGMWACSLFLSLYQAVQENYNVCHIFLVKWNKWGKHRNKLSLLITMLLLCIYIGGSNKQVNVVYFLNGSFYELANSLCHRNCGINGYFFFVYWSEMLRAQWYVPPICVHTCMYRRFTSAGMRETCLWTLM